MPLAAMRSRMSLTRYPAMTRANVARELLTASTLPVAISMIEGGVAGVLAKKLFEVNEFQFATLVAAPMFANSTSFLWTRYTQGVSKVRAMNLIHGVMLAIVAGIALLPVSAWGGWGLVVMVVACRMMLAGAVAVRSTIWRNNYPRDWRGRITSRFAQRAMLLLSLGPLALYAPLDWKPELFRVIYPLAAAVGIVGAWSFSRVRVRREKEQLLFERGSHGGDDGWGGTAEGESPSSSVSGSPASRPLASVAARASSQPGYLTVLRRDRFFRKYMTAQMLAGLANMAGFTAATLVIVDLTTGMRNEYGVSVLLTQTVPLLAAVVSMPWFAAIFDRQHITRYRLTHGLTWIVGQSLYIPAAILGQPWLFAVPQLVKGMAMGGGNMAWNLGHNDFADRRLVSTYMGIHMTLTGMRGVVAPYLGVLLLRGTEGGVWTLGGVTLLRVPAWPGLGWGVFVVTMVVTLWAYLSFFLLRREVRHDESVTRHASRALADERVGRS